MLTRIGSRDNPLLVRLRRLARDPAAYRKFGQVLIEGEHLCAAFVACRGAAPQALISEAGWRDPALRELACSADAVAVLPAPLFASISGLESPAPLAFVVPWAGPGQLVAAEAAVVRDRLQDPGNVGAVLRSAAAFGVAQVIALEGTAALWSPKVVRSGMGAHFGLRLVEGAHIDDLAALAMPMLGASSHAVEALHDVALPWPCAWVIGHEGQGMSAALQQRCRLTLRIPQPGGGESLNAAAAATVCLYESARQRLVAGGRGHRAAMQPT